MMNHLNELLAQVNSSNQEMEGKMREGKYLSPHIASALLSDDYGISVRVLSHYEGTLLWRGKKSSRAVRFFFLWKTDILDIRGDYPSTIGMNDAPQRDAPRRFYDWNLRALPCLREALRRGSFIFNTIFIVQGWNESTHLRFSRAGFIIFFFFQSVEPKQAVKKFR